MNADHVFRLIESLSKAEKKSFRQLATCHRQDSAYLRLFDLVLKANKPDVDSLAKQMSINGKRLRRLLDYIFESILQMRRDQELENRGRLWLRLEDIRGLMEGGHYGAAVKLIRGAKLVAKEEERFSIHLQLIEWEEQMEGWAREGTELAEEEAGIMAQFSNYWGYRLIRKRLRNAIDAWNRKGEKMFFSSFTNDPLLQNPEFLSVRAELEYLRIMQRLETFQENYLSAIEATDKMVHLIKQNHHIDEDRMVLTRALDMLAGLYAVVGNHGKADETYQLLWNVPTDSKLVWRTKFIRYTLGKISTAADTGNIEPGLEAVEILEEQLPSLLEGMEKSYYNLLLFHTARFLFIAGEHKRALRWIKQLEDLPKSEIIANLRGFARILRLQIYISSKEIFFDHELRSAKRYYASHRVDFQMPYVFLDFASEWLKCRVEDQKEVLSRYLSQFEKLKSDSFQVRAFFYTDVAAWVQAELMNRPLSEVVSENVLYQSKTGTA